MNPAWFTVMLEISERWLLEEIKLKLLDKEIKLKQSGDAHFYLEWAIA